MPDNSRFPYYFTYREFEYNDTQYKISLTPELFPIDEDLDFTGNYLGLLISSEKGTLAFQLNADESTRWETEPKSMDPGLIDEIDKIIQEIRRS